VQNGTIYCNAMRGLGPRQCENVCKLEAGHVERGQTWHVDANGQRWADPVPGDFMAAKVRTYLTREEQAAGRIIAKPGEFQRHAAALAVIGDPDCSEAAAVAAVAVLIDVDRKKIREFLAAAPPAWRWRG